jgi:hypothetical protein
MTPDAWSSVIRSQAVSTSELCPAAEGRVACRRTHQRRSAGQKISTKGSAWRIRPAARPVAISQAATSPLPPIAAQRKPDATCEADAFAYHRIAASTASSPASPSAT